MKRIGLVLVMLVALLTMIFPSYAAVPPEGWADPKDSGIVQFRCNLSLSGSTVNGVVQAALPSGCTIQITVNIQYKSTSGTWYTRATAVGNGATTVPVSCDAVSGTSYRLRYTYRLCNSTGALMDSGTGYSSVLQVP